MRLYADGISNVGMRHEPLEYQIPLLFWHLFTVVDVCQEVYSGIFRQNARGCDDRPCKRPSSCLIDTSHTRKTLIPQGEFHVPCGQRSCGLLFRRSLNRLRSRLRHPHLLGFADSNRRFRRVRPPLRIGAKTSNISAFTRRCDCAVGCRTVSVPTCARCARVLLRFPSCSGGRILEPRFATAIWQPLGSGGLGIGGAL